jgi:hypothetical protein
VALAVSCGNSIENEDICRECVRVMGLETARTDGPVSEDAVTKKIVVPHKYRKATQKGIGDKRR